MIPTVTEGFYNLKEEMDNIMISNTRQDLELIQLQTGLSAAQGNVTTVGVLAGTANINALAAIGLTDNFFIKLDSNSCSSNSIWNAYVFCTVKLTALFDVKLITDCVVALIYLHLILLALKNMHYNLFQFVSLLYAHTGHTLQYFF